MLFFPNIVRALVLLSILWSQYVSSSSSAWSSYANIQCKIIVLSTINPAECRLTIKNELWLYMKDSIDELEREILNFDPLITSMSLVITPSIPLYYNKSMLRTVGALWEYAHSNHCVFCNNGTSTFSILAERSSIPTAPVVAIPESSVIVVASPVVKGLTNKNKRPREIDNNMPVEEPALKRQESDSTTAETTSNLRGDDHLRGACPFVTTVMLPFKTIIGIFNWYNWLKNTVHAIG